MSDRVVRYGGAEMVFFTPFITGELCGGSQVCPDQRNQSKPTMKQLVHLFYHFEVESPTYSWIERIPSASNPADGPSRDSPQETSDLGVSKCEVLEHPTELVERPLAQKLINRKWGRNPTSWNALPENAATVVSCICVER